MRYYRLIDASWFLTATAVSFGNLLYFITFPVQTNTCSLWFVACRDVFVFRWRWSQPPSSFDVCKVSVPTAPGHGTLERRRPEGSCSHRGLGRRCRVSPSPPNTGQESAKDSRVGFCSLGVSHRCSLVLQHHLQSCGDREAPVPPGTRPLLSQGWDLGDICGLVHRLSFLVSSLNEISGLKEKKIHPPDLQPCVLHTRMLMPASDFSSFLHYLAVTLDT